MRVIWPYFIVLMLLLKIHKCWSLNIEGLALLEFRAGVDSDPFGAFANWNPSDSDPCKWSGVHCVDGNVKMLDLKGLSLEGTLAPELGTLNHLRSLILYQNHFSGVIPKEIGGLTMLELLDLRDNNLSGKIPAEMGGMLSLKHLLLCGNNFQGSIPPELGKLKFLSELQSDQNLTSGAPAGIPCLNRKFGHCIWQSSLKQLKKANSFMISLKMRLPLYLRAIQRFKFGGRTSHEYGEKCCENLPSLSEPFFGQNAQDIVGFVRRRMLEESSNLPAAPASGVVPLEQMVTVPTSRSSGAFPAVPNGKKKQPPTVVPSSSTNNPQSPHSDSQSSQAHGSPPAVGGGSSGAKWKYLLLIPGGVFLVAILAAVFCACRSRGVTTIGPWKTGLSGQLQKAFVTGVPKLNHSELETACEDFSNIIDTYADCTLFKGTLSSGVEIAVASTVISSSKDWTRSCEVAFRKKIDTLSRVNHKNFVNLLGYCEEDEPFLRMMVFEYATNGTLFEHLHVKEVEHLDWNSRMRIIMGIAYCLQYMHHELNPPVAHMNLQSSAIFLMDDYAAKIGELSFWSDLYKSKNSSGDESEHCELPHFSDPETNVYNFGILLLEIISGKLPCSEEGSLVNWAAEYLNDKRSISYMIDPTLKSFKNNVLDVICEVIEECIHQDPRQRPTINEVTSKLREVIAISPDAATPRLSPLWWAELEILSVEAT
ncbi:protein MALE DISCOVERER 2-like isoform X2 [Macadamia integrifolia]|uniref:protein MALE DISCOVERER 2-like isoform X2 n=1 Tax=Macadamia integrifolia TaxID=60698 RepID=UPI001C53133F|nr:protein MALE DISCOVERER 2-like isoform X2 [Macadamia integrifolia]